MVLIVFYEHNLRLDKICDSYEDFIAIVGASADISNPELFTYEYTLDNKSFVPLNEKNYSELLAESSKATVYLYSSKEETHYYKEQLRQNEINKTENRTENKTENKIENKSKTEKNDNYEMKITKEMVYQRILQNQREKMRLKALQEKENEKLMKEKKKEETKKDSENAENNFENLINDAICKALDNPHFKEQLINESKIMCSKILTNDQIQTENEKNNDSKLCDFESGSLEKHPGIKCSLCKNEIIGDRYLCVYCENFNYCSKCESENGFVHGHPMFKLKLRLGD